MREVSLLTRGLSVAKIPSVSYVENDEPAMLNGRSAMVISKFWTVALLLHALLLAGCSQTPIARSGQLSGSPHSGRHRDHDSPYRQILWSVRRWTSGDQRHLCSRLDASPVRQGPRLFDRSSAAAGRDHVTDPYCDGSRRTEAALPHDSQKLRQLAQERAVPYLLLALFSSAESEVPTYLDSAALPNREVGGPTCPASRRIIMPWLNWPLWMSRRDNSSLVQTAGPGRNYCVSPCRSSRMCTRSFTARCGQLRSIRRKIRPKMSCAASPEMKRLNRPSCIYNELCAKRSAS